MVTSQDRIRRRVRDQAARGEKLVIRIDVTAENGYFREQLVDPGMHELMDDFDHDPDVIEAQERIEAEDSPRRIKDLPPHQEHDHVGLHVFRTGADEIEFRSSQYLTFRVVIHFDPDYKPVAGAPESPFASAYVDCVKGQPAGTGRVLDNPIIAEQRYYKYTITAPGMVDLDPHIQAYL